MRRFPILAVAALAGLSFFAEGCSGTPKSPEEKGRAAVNHYKEGVTQFNEGRIDAGIASLQKAREIQPDYTLLRYDLARMLIVRAERADLSSMRLREAAKQDRQEGRQEEGKRKDDEALALTRGALGDFREALGHLSYVETQWPYEVNVYWFLSMVTTGLGEYDKAREYLERAIELGNPQGAQREKFAKAKLLLEQAELQAKRLKDGK